MSTEYKRVKHAQRNTELNALANVKTRENRLTADTKRWVSKLEDGTPILEGGDGIRYIDRYTTLAAALTAFGSSDLHAVLGTTITLTANATVPANIFLDIKGKGSIALNGFALTINGRFRAGLRHVFTGSGTVTFGNDSIDYVIPQWFGAKGDGATACASALNSALAAFPTMYLPPGTYSVASAVSLPAGACIFGAGKYRSILKAAVGSLGAGYAILHAANKSDILIRDIGIDGNSSNYPNDTTTVPNQTPLNIVTQLPYPTVTGILVELTAAAAADGEDITIRDCHFKYLTFFSIRIRQPNSAASYTWKRVQILNNSTYKGSYGTQTIQVYGKNNTTLPAEQIIVSGNIIKQSSVNRYNNLGIGGQNSSTDGIEINRCRNFTCTNNHVERVAGEGIRIEQCLEGVVTSNTVLESGQSGISVYNGGKNIIIGHNIVKSWGRIPNLGGMRSYGGTNYIPRESPGPYNSGSPTVTLPADPSASSWWEANIYYLQGVSTSTIPAYSTLNYYKADTAFAGTISPPTGFDSANDQGILAFRGFGGIVVVHTSEKVLVKGNIIIGNLTKDGTTSESGTLYNYASEYGIMTVHNTNEPAAYASPIVAEGNIISKIRIKEIYQPSYVDPINRKGLIKGVRLFPGNYKYNADDEITECSPSLLQNLLHAETIPALKFSTGGYLKILGASRPSLGTSPFGILMFFKLTSALNGTDRYLFDMGEGGAATAGPKIHIKNNRFAFGVTDGVDNHEIIYTTITDWGVAPHDLVMLYCTRDASGLRMLINSIPEVAGAAGAVGVNCDTGKPVGINYSIGAGSAQDVPMELYKLIVWGESFTRDQLFERINEKRLIRSGDTVRLDLDMRPFGQFFQDKANFWADRFAAVKVIHSSASGITASDARRDAFAAEVSNTNGSVWVTGADQKCLPDDFFITHVEVETSGTPTIRVGSTSGGREVLPTLVLTAGKSIIPINRASATGKLSLTSSTTDSIKWVFHGFRAPGCTVQASTLRRGNPYALHTLTTPVGNVGTGEDNLMLASIPNSTLVADGDSLKITCAGTFAATANNKRIIAYLGVDTVFDTGTLAISNASDWKLEIEIIRTGSAAQKAISTFRCSDTTVTIAADYTTLTRTMASDNDFKLTGTATNDDDVVQQLMKILVEPA